MPRNLFTMLAAVAVGAVTLAALSASSPDALWHQTLDDHPGFSPVVPSSVQELWPTLGTVTGLAAHFTALGERLLAGVGLDAIVSPVRAAGVGAVLLVFAIVCRLGCGTFAAAISSLAFAFSGLFWSRAAGEQPVMYATCLALATSGGLVWWRQTRRPMALVALAASYTLTVAVHPWALVALPVLIAAVPRSTRASGLPPQAVLAALLVAAALGSWGFWWSVDGVLVPGDWIGLPGLGMATDRLGALGRELATDFGELGLALLVTGAVRSVVARSGLLGLLGGWSAAVGIGAIVGASPEWRSPLLPALASAWPIVGIGIAWVLRVPSHRATVVAICGIVVALPVMNLARHRTTGARARAVHDFVARALVTIADPLPPDVVIISEGGVVDRALEERRRRGMEGPRRVAQDPDAIRRLWEGGTPVVGLAGARANLLELGLHFSPVATPGVGLTLAELLRSVPEGWIVAAAIGSRFPLGVPPRSGATFRSIGGRVDLFGSSRTTVRYGIVAVKGRDGVLEQIDTERVELAVDAGEALGTAFRAPVALRVVSTDEGGLVQYAGRPVARTTTGLALAVVSPVGALALAHGAEQDRETLTIPFHHPALTAGRVTGSEPCVAFGSDGWADITAPARHASLATVLGSRQRVVVYAGSRHPLDSRQIALNHPYAPTVDVRAYRQADEQDAAALRLALQADGLDRSVVDTHAFVSRIAVRSPFAGRSQLALRLGGFADEAVARMRSDDRHARATICSAMRGGEEPLGPAGEDAFAGKVDIEQDDLFVFGWNAVERHEPLPFRWTRVPDAEVLVPVAREGPMTLEIDASPSDPAGTMLRVQLNEAVLTPFELHERGVSRWEVPAGAVRAGLNRLHVGADLVRPIDIGTGNDTRALGVAVRTIRLIDRRGGSSDPP